ncbi:hypothetical protein BGX38DRAFT_1266446 [Terfezia claveryi]|nr:hypothetical protein BGX38DRAFT_1266446 [Terfezia claveryi]
MRRGGPPPVAQPQFKPPPAPPAKAAIHRKSHGTGSMSLGIKHPSGPSRSNTAGHFGATAGLIFKSKKKAGTSLHPMAAQPTQHPHGPDLLKFRLIHSLPEDFFLDDPPFPVWPSLIHLHGSKRRGSHRHKSRSLIYCLLPAGMFLRRYLAYYGEVGCQPIICTRNTVSQP